MNTAAVLINMSENVILDSCLKLNLFLTSKNANRAIKGYMAGYILKASTNSPLNKNNRDRCNPHPGQSTPRNCFVKQGSMYFSMLSIYNNADSCMVRIIQKLKITTIFG